MGNTSQNRTNQLLDQQRTGSASRYQPFLDETRKRGDSSYYDSQERLSGLSGRYDELSRTGGFEPGAFDKLRESYGSGGFSGDRSTAEHLSNTGGIDESKFAGALSGYEEFARGGNVNADAIRARSNSAVPSFYKNLQNTLEQRKLVNPYSPTFDAESRAMARQRGQETQRAIQDTELSISDRISDNKRFGVAGLGNLNSAIQGMVQQGKIAGGNQKLSYDSMDHASREAAASRRFSGEAGIAEMIHSGKLKGLGGLQGLFDTQNENSRGFAAQYLGGLEGLDNSQLGSIANRQNTTPWWQKVLGAASGPAAAYFGARGGA